MKTAIECLEDAILDHLDEDGFVTMRVEDAISAMNSYTNWRIQRLGKTNDSDLEVNCKMVLADLLKHKGYGKEFTDEDLLNGLKTMTRHVLKNLLKV